MIETILGIVLAITTGVVYILKRRDTEKEKASQDAKSQLARDHIHALEREKLTKEYQTRAHERSQETATDTRPRSSTPLVPKQGDPSDDFN